MHTFYQSYEHDFQWTKDHPMKQVIGEPSQPVMTRNQLRTDVEIYMRALSVSTMEPKNAKEAMTDVGWIKAMQEELHQFKQLDVWELVPHSDNIKPLTLNWLFKNKLDEEQSIIRNKARLVVRGYRQEKRVDFEESFALEEVYVCQPEGFIDADQSSHVYKLKKALYGLKQAPRTWYDNLLKFLLQNHFTKGTIDPTLFTRRYDINILVVQVYLDDIIFGLTNPRYSQLFSDLAKSRFEMSMMGEMMLFLGLQVNQSPCGIFLNQSNFVLEILKKHGMENYDPIGTPMENKHKLDLDMNGTPVDATKYQSMIGSLMYEYIRNHKKTIKNKKTRTRERKSVQKPEAKARKSQPPGEISLFKLLFSSLSKGNDVAMEKAHKDVGFALITLSKQAQGTVNMDLWYTKDSGFKLTGFLDAHQARYQDTVKSTFGGTQFLGEKLSAIAISCNPIQHSRTKHIAVCYHFIKEHVEKGTIELYIVKTDYQLADIFTKALPKERFNYLVRRLGMHSFTPQELERLAKSQ
ncbi:retrovirus-related pol polyprotein from transposon TNT 1-94 [Tanacetum coccineum]